MSKERARADVLAARRARGPDARAAAAEAIAAHALATPVVARARRVACYLSMPTEPGTGPLIDGLLARGAEVLVPLSREDRSLDWVLFDRSAQLHHTPLGIPEPDGEPQGPDALASCDVVIVPALAADHAGNRLGRGAGYYDRALASIEAVVVTLLFADELWPEVPHEPHDVPVRLVITPDGTFRVP